MQFSLRILFLLFIGVAILCTPAQMERKRAISEMAAVNAFYGFDGFRIEKLVGPQESVDCDYFKPGHERHGPWRMLPYWMAKWIHPAASTYVVSLEFDGSFGGDVGTLAPAAAFSQLRSLTLLNVCCAESSFLETLPHPEKLRSLSLEGVSYLDCSSQWLEQCRSLEVLKLSGHIILTEENLASIRNLPKLHTLEFACYGDTVDKILRSLRGHPTLIKIEIKCPDYTIPCYPPLTASLDQLSTMADSIRSLPQLDSITIDPACIGLNKEERQPLVDALPEVLTLSSQ